MTPPSPKKPHLLFVDDEADLLAGLRQTLRKERGRWSMDFAQGTAAALAKLAQQPADLVVTDMRMPLLDGAKLLKEVHERYPEALRFVLSGEASETLSLRAVPYAHQWLSKPCSRETLVQAIERSLTLMAHLEAPHLKAWVAGMQGLPSAPASFQGLQDALQEPEADLDTISEWIEQDAGLTARVLQLTNSSFFARRQTVGRVRDAVMTIGFRLLAQIILAAEIVTVFGENSSVVQRVMDHSQKVAWLAKHIALDLELDSHRALSAGLLHDVGRMVLAQHARSQTGSAAVPTQACPHGELGGALLQSWGLPHEIVVTATFHHHPLAVPSQGVDVLGVVHMANAIVEDSEPEADYLATHDLARRFAGWRASWRAEQARREAA